MKVCEVCGDEIDGKDGENRCQGCENNTLGYSGKPKFGPKKKTSARVRRAANNEVMESLGLKKVRGALGGTYWE